MTNGINLLFQTVIFLATARNDMKKYFETNISKIVEEKMKNVKLPCTAGFEKMEKEINELRATLDRIESKLNK